MVQIRKTKKNVLLFGGTTEGRQAAERLLAEGVPCTVCVATQYGEEVLSPHPLLSVHVGRLDCRAMAQQMQEGPFCCVIDATHPHAQAVSQQIRSACAQTGIPCLRLRRDTEAGDESAVFVRDATEAGTCLAAVSGRILVTTGSKELGDFVKALGDPSRVTARVLPAQTSILACTEAGLTGRQIFAMQGPFDTEMNCAMIRHAGAQWLLTKETGLAGGYPQKLEAVRKCGIRAVVIRTPAPEEKANADFAGEHWQEMNLEQTVAAALDLAVGRDAASGRVPGNPADTPGFTETGECLESTEARNPHEFHREAARGILSLIGIGPGAPGSMTIEAREAIDGAEILFGAKSVLQSVALSRAFSGQSGSCEAANAEAAGSGRDGTEAAKAGADETGTAGSGKDGTEAAKAGADETGTAGSGKDRTEAAKAGTDGFSGKKNPAESAPNEFDLTDGKTVIPLYDSRKILDYLEAHPQVRRAAVLYSGDSGFYSGAASMLSLLRKKYQEGLPEGERWQGMEDDICLSQPLFLRTGTEKGPEPDTAPTDGRIWDIHVLCGISSLSWFSSRIGVPWQDWKILSSHGRSCNVVGHVRRNRRCFLLLSGVEDLRRTGRLLAGAQEAGILGLLRLFYGYELSRPQEEIRECTPRELMEVTKEGLYVLLIENCFWQRMSILPGLPDSAFLRGGAPMTSSEIRALSLCKLAPGPKAVIWDVGAGTGSVSVEAALACPEGRVFSIEYKKEALELLAENRERFCLQNMEIVEGRAPEILKHLPPPTHVFIGGSGGQIREILLHIFLSNPGARIVANCITSETLAALKSAMEDFRVTDVDCVQVSVNREKKLGRYHYLRGTNPVFVISFTGSGTGYAAEYLAAREN